MNRLGTIPVTENQVLSCFLLQRYDDYEDFKWEKSFFLTTGRDLSHPGA
jgi:hypothetical protein